MARGVAALAQDPEVARFAGQVLTAYGMDEQRGTDIERFRCQDGRPAVGVAEAASCTSRES